MVCIVANAFSLNMLVRQSVKLEFLPVTVAVATDGSGFFLDTAAGERICVKREEVVSAVGHADTAAVFSGILGANVPMNRTTLHGLFQEMFDDMLLVGQYSGPRLAEGLCAKKLII